MPRFEESRSTSQREITADQSHEQPWLLLLHLLVVSLKLLGAIGSLELPQSAAFGGSLVII